MTLILASSSSARHELLSRLQIPFDVVVPDIDETALPDEAPHQLVERLSRAKGMKIANSRPTATIISSDQVIIIRGIALSKPESHEDAVGQLQAASGQWVESLTGLAFYRPETQEQHYCCVSTNILFKTLSLTQIETYLQQDKPYHCAGSLRVEGLGIRLLDKIHSDDPTALIGLPLIRLCDFLDLVTAR